MYFCPFSVINIWTSFIRNVIPKNIEIRNHYISRAFDFDMRVNIIPLSIRNLIAKGVFLICELQLLVYLKVGKQKWKKTPLAIRILKVRTWSAVSNNRNYILHRLHILRINISVKLRLICGSHLFVYLRVGLKKWKKTIISPFNP